MYYDQNVSNAGLLFRTLLGQRQQIACERFGHTGLRLEQNTTRDFRLNVVLVDDPLKRYKTLKHFNY